MAEAGGADHGRPTKPTKHGGGWGCRANAGIFNGELTEGDRHDIADNHNDGNSGTPF